MNAQPEAGLPASAHMRHPDPQAREKVPWLLGLLCFLIPALPSISVLPGPLRSNGSPARLIAILCFGLAVLGFVAGRRTSGYRGGANPGVVLIVLYFLLQMLIYGVGVLHLDTAFIEAGKTRAVIVLFANVGVALYVLAVVKTARQRSILLGFLVAGLGFACLVGLLQSFSGADLRYLFQPPGFILNLEEVDLTERYGALRVVGTSTHAIEFSVLVAATVPLTLHLARYAGKALLRRLAAGVCLAALIAMPAAVSRSGVIALAAALFVYMFALTLRQIGAGILIGIGGVLGYMAVFPNAANALWLTIVTSQDDGSVLTRIDDYAAVAQTFHAHPWFGLGLGASDPTVYRFLDNEWLQAIVQGGIAGFVAMTLVITSGLVGIPAGLRGARSRRDRDQVYAMGGALVAIASSSVTFDLFSYQQATFVYFILFGLLWSAYSNHSVDPPAETPPGVTAEPAPDGRSDARRR
ncbi:O-antigen ligase family protein [Rhodococcus sp. NPDC058514]|uniref:O-antigen ligase family protein n=1 Tax=Rhodococcus sp. NPDC058514 TaxID=3346532 RepID=UPI00365D79DF